MDGAGVLESEGVVGVYGLFVVWAGVGSGFFAALVAAPAEGGVHEGFALVVGIDIPAFDVEDGGGHAFFGGGADGEFDEADWVVTSVEGEEALEGLGFEGV